MGIQGGRTDECDCWHTRDLSLLPLIGQIVAVNQVAVGYRTLQVHPFPSIGYFDRTAFDLRGYEAEDDAQLVLRVRGGRCVSDDRTACLAAQQNAAHLVLVIPHVNQTCRTGIALSDVVTCVHPEFDRATGA